MTATITKRGNNLFLRIPKDLTKKNKLEEGTQVEFIDSYNGLLIRKTQKKLILKDIIDSYPPNYEPDELIPDIHHES